MSKKIYDIKPPKAAQKTRIAPTALKKRRTARKEIPIFVPEKEQVVTSESLKRDFPLKEVLIGGGVIVVLIGIYFYNSLAYATIEIFPKTDVLSFQEKVSADKSYDNVNLLKKVIPARLLLEEKQGSQQFPATGSASNDGKATGSIKVYNKINPSKPISLKAGTHFLSDGDKYFVSLDKMVVPAMKNNSAGSIEVRVQAQESGTDYNIGASKFSVPKLSGTSYYYSIWGESKVAMSGGYIGNVKKVTASDISSAKDVLAKKLLDDAEASLRSKIAKDEVLLDGAIVKDVANATADVKDGAIADAFNETAKVTATALVFKKDDLQKFAKLDAVSRLTDGKDILEKSLEASYAPDSVDIHSGLERINVKVSATSYYFVDRNALVDGLAQKSSDQIKNTINQQYPEKVSAIKINFWPFWVHTAPKDKNKIKINLNFQ